MEADLKDVRELAAKLKEAHTPEQLAAFKVVTASLIAMIDRYQAQEVKK